MTILLLHVTFYKMKLNSIQWTKIKQKKQNYVDVCYIMCRCLCSEGPHAWVDGWGSVWGGDSYIQVVSNLEALRLQRHGVVGALPAR